MHRFFQRDTAGGQARRHGAFSVVCALAWFVGTVGSVSAAESSAPSGTVLGGGGSDKAVNITADTSLEWHRDQRLYVARGNAKAIQGTLVVEADTLLAHARPPESTPPSAQQSAEPGSGHIDRMTAEGHVRITDGPRHATGDHGVYDLNRHVMVLTGQDLTYDSGEDIVTARDSLEYSTSGDVAVARGHAMATRPDRHVEGDVLTAWFKQAPEGGARTLTRLAADGNVVIVTPTTLARADKAVYDPERSLAVLTGTVRITEGTTQMAGRRAEMDMTTGRSRLLGQGQRVSALLVPDQENSSKKPPSSTTSTKPKTAGRGPTMAPDLHGTTP